MMLTRLLLVMSLSSETLTTWYTGMLMLIGTRSSLRLQLHWFGFVHRPLPLPTRYELYSALPNRSLQYLHGNLGHRRDTTGLDLT
jgi:hypothetical protein